MAKNIDLTKRDFYFSAQGGLCYLQNTEQCLARGGAMTLKSERGREDARSTWDHLRPRLAGGRNARNILLACNKCNTTKGSRESATPEHFAWASQLWDDYQREHMIANQRRCYPTDALLIVRLHKLAAKPCKTRDLADPNAVAEGEYERKVAHVAALSALWQKTIAYRIASPIS